MKQRPLFIKRIFILAFVSILLSLLSDNFLFAKEKYPDVILNEIMWGKDKDEEEWVELKNMTGSAINLSGWRIDNSGSSGKTVEIERGLIPAGGYFLICDNNSKKDYCDFYVSISLTNDYQKNGQLVLENKSGVIDKTPPAVNSKWPAGDNNNVSMQRSSEDGRLTSSWVDYDPPAPKGSGILLSANAGSSIISLTGKEINFNGSKSTGNIKDFFWNFGDGTTAEGKEISHSYDFSGQYIVSLTVSNGRKEEEDNIFVTIYSDSLFISEFSPKKEWIEIVNESDQIQNISDWSISNKRDKAVFKFEKGSFIAPNSFILLQSSLVGSAILKNGGSLFFFYPSGDVRQQINYGDYEGSIARKNSDYFYTDAQTPGTENVISGDSGDIFPQKSTGGLSSGVATSDVSGEKDGDLTTEGVDKAGIISEAKEAKLPAEEGKLTAKNLLSEVKNTKGKMLGAAGAVTLFSGTFGLGLVRLRRKLKKSILPTEKIQVEIEE